MTYWQRMTLAAIMLATGTVRGQGTAADYGRAAGLYARFRDQVGRARVQPTWFDNGKRFWYRVEPTPRTREFVLVDAEAGKRAPAFDHARVAAELTRQTSRKVTADALPIDRLTFTADAQTVRFEAHGRRWRFDRSAGTLTPEKTDPEKPKEKTVPVAAQRRRDGAASPDGRWRAFFRDHNVHLRDEKTGNEAPLSRDGKADDGYGGGMWWSPDSRRLVALRTRPGTTRRVYLIESAPKGSINPKLHSHHYPKPGDDVAQSKPHLFDVQARKEIAIADDLFPNPWSVDRLRWEADSARFTFLYNQRGHQALRVIAVDAATGKATALVDETSKTFIDYAHKFHLHWLEGTNELVWMSERDGWNHLYLVDARTGKVKNPITRGEWVVRKVDRIDEKARQVYFRAGGIRPGQDPYHVHFARVNLDGSGLTVLTEGDGTHEVAWSPDGRYLIDTWSRVDHAPVTELRRGSDGKLVCTLERADLGALRAAGWQIPERFVARGRDGTTDIHGILIRPTTFDPAKKYPVIEDIYAGPQSAFVPKAFRPYFEMMAMAELGFIVVKIDGMGTSHRSKAFHDVCCKNLGDSGFPDRIRWMQEAAKTRPWMDLARVGVYGGSAGGQSSTRAVLAHGDFYKAAVSDCGCHDNRVDKVWWNELWMGWPIGPHYAAQSNATNAHRLTGKLMLVVGELDRNVDPACTFQVVDALIKANKDFDLLVIPGAGHGACETPYGRRRRQDFFVRHLLGVEPRRTAGTH